MAGKIFVNYRREDARADARSIRDRLAGAFGEKTVFMDVDDLEPGERFDRKLDLLVPWRWRGADKLRNGRD